MLIVAVRAGFELHGGALPRPGLRKFRERLSLYNTETMSAHPGPAQNRREYANRASTAVWRAEFFALPSFRRYRHLRALLECAAG